MQLLFGVPLLYVGLQAQLCGLAIACPPYMWARGTPLSNSSRWNFSPAEEVAFSFGGPFLFVMWYFLGNRGIQDCYFF